MTFRFGAKPKRSFAGKYALCLLFLLACGQTAIGQAWEYGLGFQHMSVYGNTISHDRLRDRYSQLTTESEMFFLKVDGGYNVPVITIQNEMTLGLLGRGYAGVSVAGSGSNGAPLPMAINLCIPTYLTLRYGAGSNKKSELPFGIGVGFGYQMTGFLAEGTMNGNPEDDYIYGYLSPNLMVEMSLDLGDRSSWLGNTRLRFEKQFVEFSEDKFCEECRLPYGFTFNQWALGLHFFMDYK